MTTTASVEALYTNILRRSGTASEVASFVSVIDAGNVTLAQTQQLLNDSTEATSFVDPIVRLYQSAFGRQPDAAGLDYWVAELRAGTQTIIEISAGFAGSTEFTDDYGTGTTVDAGYLASLYLNVLGRTPAGFEIDFWVNSGDDRATVLRGFSDSAEFVASSQSNVDQLLDNAAADIAFDTSAALSAIPGGSVAAGVVGSTFTLTTGVDTGSAFTGTDDNDIFNAAAGTFSALDTIDGGAGTDVMAIATTTWAIPVSATIVNVETLSISDAGVANVVSTAFTGLTNLTVSGVGGVNVTSAATTAITAVNTGAQAMTIIGGGSVSSFTTGAQAITVGGTAVANAFTTISATNTQDDNNGDITIQDRSGASAVTGGTLTSVILSGGGDTNTVTSNGLTSLTLSGASTDVTTVTAAAGTRAITINLGVNTAATVADATATTATVNVTGAQTGNSIVSVDAATTVTINGTIATTLNQVNVAAATAMNLSATGAALILTDVAGGGADNLVTAYTVTGDSLVTVTNAIDRKSVV